MELKCINKKCLHLWNYKGEVTDADKLVSCPKCHYRNQLSKLKITHSQENQYRRFVVKPQTEFIETKKQDSSIPSPDIEVKTWPDFHLAVQDKKFKEDLEKELKENKLLCTRCKLQESPIRFAGVVDGEETRICGECCDEIADLPDSFPKIK